MKKNKTLLTLLYSLQLIIFTIQEDKHIVQLSLYQKETHVNICDLIPIPNARSNKFGDKAVKICSTNTLARDLEN